MATVNSFGIPRDMAQVALHALSLGCAVYYNGEGNPTTRRVDLTITLPSGEQEYVEDPEGWQRVLARIEKAAKEESR